MTNRQTVGWANGCTDGQTDKQTNRQVDGRMGSWTDRQTDRRTNTKTDINLLIKRMKLIGLPRDVVDLVELFLYCKYFLH